MRTIPSGLRALWTCDRQLTGSTDSDRASSVDDASGAGSPSQRVRRFDELRALDTQGVPAQVCEHERSGIR